MRRIWPLVLFFATGCWWLGSRSVSSLAGVVAEAETGQPLAGARVLVLEAGRAAETDAGGRFWISGLTAGRYTIAAAANGCLATLDTLTLRGEQQHVVDVALAAWAPERFADVLPRALEHAEGVAMQVFTVADFARSPAANVAQLLQREVPDMISSPRGRLNTGAQVRGRGSSLQRGNTVPAIFVDDVRVAGGPTPGTTAGEVLRDLPLTQVRRIEILRGAAANALLGSHGAAGAIRVYTLGAAHIPFEIPMSFCATSGDDGAEAPGGPDRRRPLR